MSPTPVFPVLPARKIFTPAWLIGDPHPAAAQERQFRLMDSGAGIPGRRAQETRVITNVPAIVTPVPV